MNKVRVGIIGCGGFGNFHLDNLLKMPQVIISALATGNKERLHKTAEKVPSARLYLDSQEMLENEALDAVVICVTPERHGKLEAICAARNINFYVEKPLGLSIDNLKENERIIKNAGIITAVGYQERYNPALTKIKEIVSKSPVGLVRGSWIGTMPDPLWWRTKSCSGGQIVEQTTHLFDAMRYIFGEVENIFSVGQKHVAFFGLEHDVEDYSSSTLCFRNGVIANIDSGCYALNKSATSIGFEIFLQDSKIKYEWNNSMTISTNGTVATTDIKDDCHFISLKTFIDAVISKDSSAIKSDYSDGVKSCALTLLAEKSLQSGTMIAVS